MKSNALLPRRPSAVLKSIIATLLGLSLVAFAACSGDDSDGGGGCAGVEVDGVCQTKCDPELCVTPGSICNFQNECAAPCDANGNADCPLGQNCGLMQVSDGQGYFCYTPDFAKKDGGVGQYEPCTTDAECDTQRGYSCVDQECKLACTGHADCVGIGYCGEGKNLDGGVVQACVKSAFKDPYTPCQNSAECNQPAGYSCVEGECRLVGCKVHDDCASIGHCGSGLDDTGKYVRACVKGTTYPEGQFGTKCVQGDECDTANDYTCIGAGPGDVDAYCTKTGCTADTDCATGFFCASVRTSRQPCQATCPGVTTGTTNCVAPGQIGPGQEFSCGPISLLRNLCLKREYCNECETDADCLGEPNQFCVKDKSGNKKCTTVCDPATPNACPWGNASQCSVWDPQLALPGICNAGECFTCAHRFGSCEGTGKSCEPCVDDADCPTGLCAASDFTQEKFCVDLGPTCDCTGLPLTQNSYCLGGGCPQTPGGLGMRCFGGAQVPVESILKNKCYGANASGALGGSPQTGCWPPL